MATPADIVVYLGPSLPVTEARAILDADYRNPVRRGDIALLLKERTPATIAVIDGVFLQDFSISPKEILIALDRGIPVYGASSMGALRAVELEAYGMVGVGDVFELYRSGEVDGDDEVAVVFDPDRNVVLSEPLANVRIATRRAVDLGFLTDSSARQFIAAGKRIHYPHRTYARIFADADLTEDEMSRFRRFLSDERPDAKADDARALLRELASAGSR